MLVIVGTMTNVHFLRCQVGIGLELDCLLGQFARILWISDSAARIEEEKSGGVVGGDDVVRLLTRDR